MELMNKLYWAKIKEDAIIPSKRAEDAGYDIYPCFSQQYLRIPKHTTVMVPTGLACAFPSDYVLILKERGSTGTRGLAQRSGVIDSGYRGEILVPITNTNDHDIWITKGILDDTVDYSYNKAICQAILVPVANLDSKEISYEELSNISSERGSGLLGSSGK